MPYSLNGCLVVGISSRALFDLEAENTIFENEGVKSFVKYQREHEKDILNPGAGFNLVKALLNLNTMGDTRMTEVIIMSKNSADSSLRIFNSIEHYGLDISRAALVSGSRLSPYLPAFETDLFLSANAEDVQEAINSGTAAGIICTQPDFKINAADTIDQIKIAFDGDAVLFSDESEKIYKENGISAFMDYERQNAKNPLPEGPFARFLRKLASIQEKFPGEKSPIKTALVTSRNAPAHERVIMTLRAWNVRIDEAFFLGGVEKGQVLKAFGANIFFDDQPVHIGSASMMVPSARVPYKTE